MKTIIRPAHGAPHRRQAPVLVRFERVHVHRHGHGIATFRLDAHNPGAFLYATFARLRTKRAGKRWHGICN
jgi:hypothetical protein